MRRTIMIVTVAVLAVLVVKILVEPSRTVASSGPADSSQNTMAIYDLHTGYRDMKKMPIQEAPQP